MVMPNNVQFLETFIGHTVRCDGLPGQIATHFRLDFNAGVVLDLPADGEDLVSHEVPLVTPLYAHNFRP